jgi:polysaccharide export outer membrane protein
MPRSVPTTAGRNKTRTFHTTFLCVLILTSPLICNDLARGRFENRTGEIASKDRYSNTASSAVAPADMSLRQIAQSDQESEAFPARKQTPRTQAADTGLLAGTAASISVASKPNDPADPNDYIIGEQDYLTITVWKEKELSGSVVVRPDGKITVPLVGETKVVGMTPVQVQSLLEQRLKPFIAVPQVTVAVSQINSRRVYLIGQVVKEGSYQINSSTTVLQLIAQAGGLRDFAKRKNIYILRNHGSGQSRYSFNYEAVVRGKNQDQNIFLQPGDTIVVP